MAKQAISVTLDADNLTWLKGRASAAGVRSVSELLDQLVSAARSSGRIGPSRSVVGTIDLASSDPWLETADETICVVVRVAPWPAAAHRVGLVVGNHAAERVPN